MNYCMDAYFLLRTFKKEHSPEGVWFHENVLQAPHGSVILSIFTEINLYSHASRIPDPLYRSNAISDISEMFYDVENGNLDKHSVISMSRENLRSIGIAQPNFPDMSLEALVLLFIHEYYNAQILISSQGMKKIFRNTKLIPDQDYIEF